MLLASSIQNALSGRKGGRGWERDSDRSRQAGVVGGRSNVRAREGSPRKVEYCIETARIDLDDQQATGVQMWHRAFDQGAQDIHSVDAGMEGYGRFTPNVRREAGDLVVGEVWGIGRDDVDCSVEGVEKVSAPGVDAVVESVRSDIRCCDAEGGWAYVGRKYRSVWQVASEGDRYRSAARTDICDSERGSGWGAASRELQYRLDQEFRLLAGYENVLGYHDVESIELAASYKVGERLALYAALQGLLEGVRAAGGRLFVQASEEGSSVDTEGCAEEDLGL